MTEGPGIGPDLEWRREQRGEVIAEGPAPTGADRGTLAAWLIFLGRSVGHRPSSTEGGAGRALPGRKDWRPGADEVADPGMRTWHNAWSPPPAKSDPDLDVKIRQLREDGWI